MLAGAAAVFLGRFLLRESLAARIFPVEFLALGGGGQRWAACWRRPFRAGVEAPAGDRLPPLPPAHWLAVATAALVASLAG